MGGVTVSTLLLALSAVLVSYVIGSIPAASWLARSRGVDIRKVGSGNSGATNVLRSLGKGPAFLVALFDILKGALVVWLARALGLPPEWVGLCGVAAVIGHNFSPFLGFRGGKGVATSFGTIAALDPVVGAGAFVLGVAAMWLTRFVSAGSILGAITAILLVVALGRPVWLMLVIGFLAALLVWQHRSNIGRLTAGKESRLGEKVR
ncbi:glycerol-3-phosphate 1-O-acyltransferase PlsY [Deinococcus aerolatus]|uniref:glycerol-3-phosphate 1-O-acyltransferase PlsY n=1 Tax=Deinococcus aerolatus TaxID=522487 RepID=UPI00166B3ED8|nr:glycerol-3-phosphate 1-O-acyltransferase PlsY [Deinococcus aerolatus]